MPWGPLEAWAPKPHRCRAPRGLPSGEEPAGPCDTRCSCASGGGGRCTGGPTFSTRLFSSLTSVPHPQLPFQPPLTLSASYWPPYPQFPLSSAPHVLLPAPRSPPHPQSFRPSQIIRPQSPLLLNSRHVSPALYSSSNTQYPLHPQPPSQSPHLSLPPSTAPLTLSLPHAPVIIFSPIILSQFSPSSSVSSILSFPHPLLSLLSPLIHPQPPLSPQVLPHPCPTPQVPPHTRSGHAPLPPHFHKLSPAPWPPPCQVSESCHGSALSL